MGFVVNLLQSHYKSYENPVIMAFKLQITPSSSGQASGLHYVILLDVSGSMAGEKLELAKEGARMLVEKIPPGNYVTLIVFGVKMEPRVLIQMARVDTERERIIETIEELGLGGGTPLYGALHLGIDIARASKMPGYIILLSDGQPTDITDINAYRRMSFPEGYKALLVGIGADYNHELFALLADLTAGEFYHISEGEIEKLPEILAGFSVEEIAAKNVEIFFESPVGEVKLLNYPVNPIKLPSIEKEPVIVLGEVTVPPRYKGEVLRVRISYEEPSGQRRVLTYAARVEPAKSKEDFLASINRSVLDEYNYYLYMVKAREAILRNKMLEATKHLEMAAKLAEATRNIKYIETTRRMLEEVEATKRLGGREASEQTKRLLSEATRRIRGA